MFENNVCVKHEILFYYLLRFYFMFCLHTQFALVVPKYTRNCSKFAAWSLKSWYAYCIPVCYTLVCFCLVAHAWLF